MTANLFGERFLGNREPAWHGLGTVFTESLTAVDAIQKAECDYQVIKSQLMASVSTPFGDHLIELDDKFSLMREPTKDDDQYRHFGYCTKSYEILDNLELGRALDVLTDRWPVETVGALGKGETLFISLDAGEIEIGGEEVHQYFLFTDTKTGKKKARFMFTPVRVVCQNTLVMGEREAQINAEISHRKGAGHQVQFRLDLIDCLLKTQSISIESLRKMAAVEISNEKAMGIIAQAYPLPPQPKDVVYLENEEETRKNLNNGVLADALFEQASSAQKTYQYKVDRVKSLRQFAELLYTKINDEQPSIAGTPWSAYNAVVESADYREGRGKVLEDSLFGFRAKEKQLAYVEAVRLSS